MAMRPAHFRETIAVTGATGRQGGAVARVLLARRFKVRALTRNPSSASAKALEATGAEVVTCDLNDPRSVTAALRGVSGVFLTTTPYEKGVDAEEMHAKQAIEASAVVGVQQVVYSSVALADQPTGVPHFESKGRVERYLAEAGIPCITVLRPTFFMDMFLGDAFRRCIQQGRIELLLNPETRIAMIAVDDIAAFAAHACAHPSEMSGKVIELAGDRPSMTGLAASMSTGLECPLEYRQIGEVDLAADIRPKAGTQRWLEDVGWGVDPTNLTPYRIPLTDLATWARRHRDALLRLSA